MLVISWELQGGGSNSRYIHRGPPVIKATLPTVALKIKTTPAKKNICLFAQFGSAALVSSWRRSARRWFKHLERDHNPLRFWRDEKWGPRTCVKMKNCLHLISNGPRSLFFPPHNRFRFDKFRGYFHGGNTVHVSAQLKCYAYTFFRLLGKITVNRGENEIFSLRGGHWDDPG